MTSTDGTSTEDASTEATQEIEAGGGKTRKLLTAEQREQKNLRDRQRRAAQSTVQPTPNAGIPQTQDQQDQPYQHQMSDMLNAQSKARYARVTADRDRVAGDKHN